MGITYAAAKFLLQSGLHNPGKVLTIGRQSFLVSPIEAADLLAEHGKLGPGEKERFIRETSGLPYYVDGFLRQAGAGEVTALDFSGFEGATLLHNLNEPLPGEWHERFDLVLDGGSLEHVFNVPAALRSYMELTKVGGSLMIFTVANNFFGHGFYQFSPELFFRVFSGENGFAVDRMVVVEDEVFWGKALGCAFPVTYRSPFYEVADPAAVRQRVELVNHRQSALLVQARRLRKAPIFSAWPQQSDYLAAWKSGPGIHGRQTSGGQGPLKRWIMSRFAPARLLHWQLGLLPRMARWIPRRLWQRSSNHPSLRNRLFFKRTR